ncbi:hypothetical protein [Cypionkella sp.]|uniref:hypothetical protein n=1 Tax=Cypionkella sp. TaxID=2811411 RepID=UPI002715E826|nr:hypothetical protein [Cypionkella sp.]MDO8986427.1 hypothetical protein [Cypionkella sp.]MDP2048232.1 hypothetical protein [Cypionkella sp.]
MNEISKLAHSHSGHDHAHDGSCCGGADAKAKPQAAPSDKATDGQASDTKTKPAGSTGCCGG